jgi:hypothetical protein
MNKNKQRWKIYKLLRKGDLIPAKRGGYSLEKLTDFFFCLTGQELGIYSNPYYGVEDWVKWYLKDGRSSILYTKEEIERCFKEAFEVLK